MPYPRAGSTRVPVRIPIVDSDGNPVPDLTPEQVELKLRRPMAAELEAVTDHTIEPVGVVLLYLDVPKAGVYRIEAKVPNADGTSVTTPYSFRVGSSMFGE